jgi:hypothetical protein
MKISSASSLRAPSLSPADMQKRRQLHIIQFTRWPLARTTPAGAKWAPAHSRIHNTRSLFQAYFKHHTFSGTSLPAVPVYFTGPKGCVHAESEPKDMAHISRRLPAIVMSAACRAHFPSYLFTFLPLTRSLSVCCDSRAKRDISRCRRLEQ